MKNKTIASVQEEKFHYLFEIMQTKENVVNVDHLKIWDCQYL